jgi:hypothetical protein
MSFTLLEYFLKDYVLRFTRTFRNKGNTQDHAFSPPIFFETGYSVVSNPICAYLGRVMPDLN